jgi:hypothetical protein
MLKPVVVQDWEESERGWGVRPDGHSLHLTEADRTAYFKEYADGLPEEVPNEYSRLSGPPYIGDVDAKVYSEVKNSKNGIRILSRFKRRNPNE